MLTLKKVQRENKEERKLTTVNLKMIDYQYIKENDVVLVKLVEAAIEDLRNGGNNNETMGA